MANAVNEFLAVRANLHTSRRKLTHKLIVPLLLAFLVKESRGQPRAQRLSSLSKHSSVGTYKDVLINRVSFPCGFMMRIPAVLPLLFE